MDEAETTQAEARFDQDEIAKAKFEAQLQAHRNKTARLRAERLARSEARWIERRKDTIAEIKSGLVDLQIKTALMMARHLIKTGDLKPRPRQVGRAYRLACCPRCRNRSGNSKPPFYLIPTRSSHGIRL